MAEYNPFKDSTKRKPPTNTVKAKPNNKLTIGQALQILGKPLPPSDVPRRNYTMSSYPTYSQRSNFYGQGPTADYQGSQGYAGSGTRDRMPGTTPEYNKTVLQELLELLKIKKPDSNKNKKPIKSAGSRYVNYI
jgi:hypothetical protein